MADHRNQAGELAEALSRSAEAVCCHYLSAGRRSGHHWTVGDVDNTPGRSLFVRLTGPTSGKGAVGRWCDAATGQHGDLLDLIRLNRGHNDLRDAMDEARSFLALPPRSTPNSFAARGPWLASPCPAPTHDRRVDRGPRSSDTRAMARRLFASGQPIRGTLAERYLGARGIDLTQVDVSALRFHPAAHYREAPEGPRQTWPALLAAVTDPADTIMGVHRTYLDPSLDPARLGKAPVAAPRRSLGQLAGNGARFGPRDSQVLLVGEGLETVLSLMPLFPDAAAAAALSAAHLIMLALSSAITTLLIARDNDAAGSNAAERLRDRAEAAGLAATVLRPRLIDFNADLRRWGHDALAERVRAQLPMGGRRRDVAVRGGPSGS